MAKYSDLEIESSVALYLNKMAEFPAQDLQKLKKKNSVGINYLKLRAQNQKTLRDLAQKVNEVEDNSDLRCLFTANESDAKHALKHWMQGTEFENRIDMIAKVFVNLNSKEDKIPHVYDEGLLNSLSDLVLNLNQAQSQEERAAILKSELAMNFINASKNISEQTAYLNDDWTKEKILNQTKDLKAKGIDLNNVNNLNVSADVVQEHLRTDHCERVSEQLKSKQELHRLNQTGQELDQKIQKKDDELSNYMRDNPNLNSLNRQQASMQKIENDLSGKESQDLEEMGFTFNFSDRDFSLAWPEEYEGMAGKMNNLEQTKTKLERELQQEKQKGFLAKLTAKSKTAEISQEIQNCEDQISELSSRKQRIEKLKQNFLDKSQFYQENGLANSIKSLNLQIKNSKFSFSEFKSRLNQEKIRLEDLDNKKKEYDNLKQSRQELSEKKNSHNEKISAQKKKMEGFYSKQENLGASYDIDLGE
ncbi:MAG TPA: hypothetical protein PLQ36_00395 [Candidatus Gracilibacteria bacterium]|nr:hypothetical protein [Candidatus Gracilibacteria bacterium]